MGSTLKIKSSSSIDNIEEIFSYIEDFEKKYSRFIEWNYLSQINNGEIKNIENICREMIKLSLEVSKLSEGYFDITISPILEEIWYWKKIWENITWYQNIELNWNNLNLNWTRIEFGSIWKWYIVDYIFNKISKKSDKVIIDFWWDIKFKWDFKILLENPFNQEEAIWTYNWKNIALASSSWSKRKIWKKHHLVSAKSWESIEEVIWVYVSHKNAIIADVFSTAIFVSPLEVWIRILSKVSWLEWMIITQNSIYRSENYLWELFEKK